MSGSDPRDVVLPRQRALDLAVAAFVVDRLDAQVRLVGIVEHVEQPELADQPRAEELQDEALVAVVRPHIAQHRHRIGGAGDVGEPVLVLGRRFGADALDVAHHREAERVGVDAGIARIVEVRLEHHVGVRAQELDHVAVGHLPLLVQAVHDPVVHVGGAALVHQLGLRLRIEILRDHPDDAQDLALPGLQARRGLLEEIEDVLLRQLQQRAAALVERRVRPSRRPCRARCATDR